LKKIVQTYLTDSVVGITNAKSSILNGLLIGSAVGLIIALYDYIISNMQIISKTHIPNIYIGTLPFFGMLITAAIVKYAKLARTSMADEIVLAYHSSPEQIELKKSIPKTFASIATLGFGGSAGIEGASKWVGAILGLSIQRLINFFKPIKKDHGDLTIALMTGASAGIGAIFKAPLSGTIMALESPYKKDFAHEALVQSFIGAVTSYTVFTSLRGNSKFFIISLNYNLRWEDMLIACLIGLCSGLSSTIFLKTLKTIRDKYCAKINFFLKYIIGGLAISAIAYFALWRFNSYVTMYGGNDTIINIFHNKYTASDSIIIGFLKTLATIITFAFGGIGGLFLPSATIGACIGNIFQNIFHITNPGVFSLIGIASFIAASYNGLLFGPLLIAEITGEPSLVVLGIIASTISFLVSNGVSNSSYQQEGRHHH
jgi:CIC family chloride channel protein